MMADNPTHVVLGTGPVGLAVADVLVAAGKRVRLVNRSGKAAGVPAGVEVRAADVTDLAVARTLGEGAEVVFHCMNAPYDRWPLVFPALHAGAMEAAAGSGARLVVMENVYMYGPTGGKQLTEDLPSAATSRKGKLRGELAARVLQAHREGRVRATIGRASDFFGPRVVDSAMGERVFPALLAGKAAQVLGNPDLPHTYSYIPDVARALVVLSERDEALGQVWHLPSPETVTTRRFVALIAAELGVQPKLQAVPKPLLWMLGLFNPIIRELQEMAYEFDEPFLLNDAKFRQAFGFESTPLAEALRATIAWYRERPTAS